MGHDEVYSMCLCKRCRGQDKAQLFAQDVNRIYAYLRSKGLGMMIWDDMLNTTRSFACPDALNLIPRDIVLLNFVWYDRTDLDTEDILLRHGFPVVFGNFYSSHFPRFGQRAAKEGILGAEVSFWVGLPELMIETSEAKLGQCGKLFDGIYSANMMWTGQHRPQLRRLWSRTIAGLLPRVRDQLVGSTYPSRLSGARFTPLAISGPALAPRLDAHGSRESFDLASLPEGTACLEGIPFHLGAHLAVVESERLAGPRYPSGVEIPVGAWADSLVFLHGCTANAPQAEPLATYELVYADGSRAGVDILYGWQVTELGRAYASPLAHVHYRHNGYVGTYPALPYWQGKTATGRDATLYAYEWLNPHPDREIRLLSIRAHKQASDSAMLIAAVTLVHADRG